MNILSVFRISARVRRLYLRLRRLTVALAVFVVLFGSVIVVKNLLVSRLIGSLEKSFGFESAKISYFPPKLTITGLRTLGDAPLVRVRRAVVKMPYLSLFKHEKSIIVTVIEPEIRFEPKKAGPQKKPRSTPSFSFPLILKKVEVLRGRLVFLDEDGVAEIRGLDLLLTTSGSEFELKTSADSGSYTVFPDGLEIGGTINILVAGGREEARVRNLDIKGPMIDFRATGRVRNLLDPEFELSTEMDIETAAISSYLALPFDLRGRAGGQGRLERKKDRVSFSSDISGAGITAEGMILGQLVGNLDLNFSGDSSVDLEFRHPSGLPQKLALDISEGKVTGQVESFLLDPVMKEVGVPWPVKSPAWGRFEYGNKKLAVEAELRDDLFEDSGGRFPLAGKANVDVDFNSGEIKISSRDIRSSFGRFEAASHWSPAGEISAEIRGTLSDLKRGREFVSIMLGEELELPEIRGSGYADISVTGKQEAPDVNFKGALSPGGFDLFDASFVAAEGTISSKGFTGHFRIDDPSLNGDLAVEAGDEGTVVNISKGEGELQRVFHALGIELPISGPVAGDFEVVIKDTGEEAQGVFTSPGLKLVGIELKEVGGRFEWKDSTLFFPELNFGAFGGRVEGGFSWDAVGGVYDVDLKGQRLDLSLLEDDSSGMLSFEASGKGRFGEKKLPVSFRIEDLVYSPIQRTPAYGELLVDYIDGRFLLDVSADVVPGDNKITASIEIPAGEAPVKGLISGYFTNLDLVAPWKGAKGRADFSVRISGPKEAIVSTSSIEFNGSILPLPGFAHAIENYAGEMEIGGGRIIISDFMGTLGGGEITAAGEFTSGDSGITGIDLRLEGSDMLLSPVERTRALVDGTARLIKDDRQFVLEGDLMLENVNWRRELYEKFEFMTSTGSSGQSGPSLFEGLTLNIRLRSRGGALMDNSLGRLTARFDLTVTGSMDVPVVLGDLEIEKGNVVFQDHEFRILGGRVSFLNPGSLEPYLELRGETFVKDYRITMNLSGLTSRMRPEFSSSPPLKSEEVLALLAMGESFEKTYSTERTVTQSTASLLSYQLAGRAKKSTSGVLSLDRFRIDPLISESSSEMTARLTLGKKLSKNFLFMYSTNLATQRKEIYRIEWNLGRDFTLVAVRDEQERIGFDLKIRKRF